MAEALEERSLLSGSPPLVVLDPPIVSFEQNQTVMFHVVANDPDSIDTLTYRLFETNSNNLFPDTGTPSGGLTEIPNGTWTEGQGYVNGGGKWDQSTGTFVWEPSNYFDSQSLQNFDLQLQVYDGSNTVTRTVPVNISKYYFAPEPAYVTSGDSQVTGYPPIADPTNSTNALTSDFDSSIQIGVHAYSGGMANSLVNTVQFQLASGIPNNAHVGQLSYRLTGGPAGFQVSPSGAVTYQINSSNSAFPPPSVQVADIEVRDAVSGKATQSKIYMQIMGNPSSTAQPFGSLPVLYDTQIPMTYDSTTTRKPLAQTMTMGFLTGTSPSVVTTSILPTKGTITVNKNGQDPTSITYTPGDNWDGTDYFTVQYTRNNSAANPSSVTGNVVTVYLYDRAVMTGAVTLEDCGCGGGAKPTMRSDGGALAESIDAAPGVSIHYDGGSMYTPIVRGTGLANRIIESFPERVYRDNNGVSLALDVVPLNATNSSQLSRAVWSGQLNELNAGEAFGFRGSLSAMQLAAGEYRYKLEISSGPMYRWIYGSLEVGGSDNEPALPNGWDFEAQDRLVPVPAVTGDASMPAGVHWIKGNGERAFFVDNGSGTFRPLDDADRTTLSLVSNVYTIRTKFGDKVEFDSTGKIVTRRDATGTALQTFGYTSGKISSITDSGGRVTQVLYDGSGKMTTVRQHLVSGATTTDLDTSLGYDGSGRLSTSTAPDPDQAGSGQPAPQTTFGYSGSNLTTVTDPDSHATSFAFDAAGRVKSKTNPDGTVIRTVAADSAATAPGTTSLNLDATLHGVDWDERGNPVLIDRDMHGNVVESIDALGNRTTYERNSKGDLLRTTEIVTETRVNSTTKTSQSASSVAVSGNGDYVVVWQSLQDGTSDIFAQQYSATGASVGSEFRVNSSTSNTQANPQVAMDAVGNFVVVWESDHATSGNRDVYYRKYSPTGTALTGEVLVNTITASNQQFPSVSMMPSGIFVVAWESYSQDAASSWGVYRRRYDASSSPTALDTAEVLVNTTTAGDQRYPDVSIDDTGKSVIVWEGSGSGDSTGIFAQRFDLSGAKAGAEFRVNTTTTNSQRDAAVALDSDGDFVVVWESDEAIQNSFDIVGQRYNASGTAQGSPFTVNPITIGQQESPDVGTDAVGNYLIVWQDSDVAGSTGLGSGVSAARYFASGAVDIASSSLSTLTTHAQGRPAIAVGDGGDLVASWDGNGPGDASGVFARQTILSQVSTEYRYDGNGNQIYAKYPDGSEETWVYDQTFNVAIDHKEPVGRVSGVVQWKETITTIDGTTGLTTKVREVLGTNDAPSNGDDSITLYTYVNSGIPVASGLPGGLLDTVTDAEGKVTKYTYWGQGDGLAFGQAKFGKLKSVTDAYETGLAMATNYDYDDIGNLKSVQTPLGTTDYKYDKLGRLLETTPPDPDGALALPRVKTINTYDAAGNLTKVELWDVATNTLQRTTKHYYDADDRRIKTELPAPNPAAPTIFPVLEWHFTNGLMDWSEDALDHRTTFAYDSLGRVQTQTLPDPDGAASTYQSLVVSYGYDGFGDQVVESRDLGSGLGIVTTRSQYDSLHRQIRVVQPDPDGATGPLLSPITESGYDQGVLAYTRDTLGRQTDYEYDSLERQSKVTQPDPDGASGSLQRPYIEFTYDKMGRTKTEKLQGDATRVTTYDYNVRGERIKATLPKPDSSQANPILEWSYNNQGLLEWSEDALDRRTHYTYDAWGRQVKAYLPDPDSAANPDNLSNTNRPVMETRFDKFGNVQMQIDPNGNQTTYEYDQLDRRTKATLPLAAGQTTNSTRTWIYDISNQLTQSIDANGVQTNVTYFDSGWIKEQTLKGTSGGSLVTTSDVLFGYDRVGNVTSITKVIAGGTNEVTLIGYDKLFREVWKQEPNHSSTQQVWHSYYATGQLEKLTDPDGNVTTFTYDALDRVVTEKNQLNAEQKFEYDQFGNRKRAIDRNARVIDYLFDALNRTTDEKWYNNVTDANNQVTPVRHFKSVYDLANQVDYVYDEIGSTTQTKYDYTEDRLGRITKEDNNGTTIAPRVVFDSTYDKSGDRLSLAATVGSGTGTKDFRNDYLYDGQLHMKEIKQQGQSGGNGVAPKLVQFTYDGEGQFSTISRYKALTASSTDLVVSTSYDRSDAGRLKQLLNKNTYNVIIADYRWTYDSALRVKTYYYDNNHGAAPPQNYTYEYADNGQLTKVLLTGTTTVVEQYQYDAAGNRTTATTPGGTAGTAGTYTNTANNRLDNDGTYKYEYDGEGNRTKQIKLVSGQPTGETRVFTWDHRNRLTNETFYATSTSTTATKTVDYRYDLLDRRITKIVDSDGAGTSSQPVETRFVYEGQQVALVYGYSGGTNSLQFRYVHGPAVDQMLVHERITTQGSAGNTSWSIADQLGSVRQIVDNAGMVDAIVDYDAFGNPKLVTTLASDVNGDNIIDAGDFSQWAAYMGQATWRQANGDVNRDGTVDAGDAGYMFGEWGATDLAEDQLFLGVIGHTELYTGRDFDAEVWLQYNRARYYDAKVGRWISEDPIGFAAGDYNVGRYVRNNPIDRTDPSGLQAPEVMEWPGEEESKAELQKLVADWKARGFTFAPALMQAFLDQKYPYVNGTFQTVNFSAVGVPVIRADADYQNAFKEKLLELAKGSPASFASVNLGSQDPRRQKYHLSWFEVEHFTVLNNYSLTSRGRGKELAWALGTGHYGYTWAKLSCSNGNFRFQANMIQADTWDFGGGLVRRIASWDYWHGHNLQADFGYAPYEHFEEWPVDITFRVKDNWTTSDTIEIIRGMP